MTLFIIIVILLILLAIMFTSVYLEIDSESKLLRLRFGWIMSMQFVFEDLKLYMKLIVFGIQINIDPNKRPKKVARKTKVNKHGLNKEFNIKRMIAIIKSFKVKELYLNVDTGNNQLNGILYPLFMSIAQLSNRDIKINFIDQNAIRLTIQNNVARMAWTYMRT